MKMSLKFGAHRRQIIHFINDAVAVYAFENKLNTNFLFGTKFDTCTAIYGYRRRDRLDFV